MSEVVDGVAESADPADLAGLAGLSVDRLEARICALAARRAADDCAWLLLIGEFDRREGFARWECASTSYWLSWHCGLSMHAAREQVRVARALADFDRVRTEFAAGRLSYSKVRAVTRVATPATEKTLVELAQAATAAQLERICAAYRQTRRDERAHAARRAERVGVCAWHDDDGLFHLHAILAPEHGAQVAAALAAGLDHLQTQAQTRAEPDRQAEHPAEVGTAGNEPVDGEQVTSGGCPASVPAGTSPAPSPTKADALVHLSRQYLTARPVSPEVERRHLLAHIDIGSLTRRGLGIDPDGRCSLNGQRLTPQAALALGADAALTTILIDHHGLPLSVGRTSRHATAAQRLALQIRDGGHCRYPGCHNRQVDAHHIVHWEHHGNTDLTNLVLLCRHHHRVIHRGHHTLTYHPDTNTVTVTGPDGQPITAIDPDPTVTPPPPDTDQPLPPGEAGTPLDLDLITGGLARQDHQARATQHDDQADEGRDPSDDPDQTPPHEGETEG